MAVFKGGRWRQAMLGRNAGNYMVLCACPQCSGPVKVPQSQVISAVCIHCHSSTQSNILAHVVDVIPTSRINAQTWGGGMTLSWEPSHVTGSKDEAIDCPKCGGPVPPFEDRHTCDHCKTPLLAFTACGQRFVPGVRIVGFDEGTNIDEWRPLHEALDHYGKRLELAKDSGKVTRRAIGCGFASVLLSFPLMCVFMGVLIFLSEINAEAGLSFGLLGFVAVAFGGVGGFISIIAYFMWRHKKKRDALLGQ